MSIPGCYSFHASESTAFSSKPYQFPENAMVLKFLNLGLEVMRGPQSVFRDVILSERNNTAHKALYHKQETVHDNFHHCI